MDGKAGDGRADEFRKLASEQGRYVTLLISAIVVSLLYACIRRVWFLGWQLLGGAVNLLWILWNLQEILTNRFATFPMKDRRFGISIGWLATASG